jgi:peptidyl-prolyl cis-trans isomerase D
MLESIRERSQGGLAAGILGVVILSFVFAGVGSYFTAEVDQTAAKVNGEEINLSTLEQAYQSERARMEAQFGQAFAELASSDEYLAQMREGVLDRLVGEILLNQQVEKLGMRASDEQVRETILGMQEFQIGGQFNSDRYTAILRQAGFQPNSFRDYLRKEITRQQLTNALLSSAFSLSKETQQILTLQQQTRDARYLTIDAKPFANDVVIDESELQAYYEGNLSNYDTQEQISVAYVELKSSDLLDTIEVSEAQIEEYYQNNINDYRSEEERRASHILFELGDNEAEVTQQAEEVLTKVQAGEDFGELAKQYSADTVSAELGGDLDWFGLGVMDPAFETAIFALDNVGEATQVVKSEFGLHIIKLTDIKPQEVVELAEVREEVLSALKQDGASEVFYNLQEQMANTAFELPDELDEVALIASTEVKTTALFSRTSAPQPLDSVIALNQVFDEALIEDRVNSDPIELDDEHILFARIEQHEPERTKAFEEVKDEIKEVLSETKAQELAKNWAQTLINAIANNESVDVLLDEKSLTWESKEAVGRFAFDMPAEVRTELFRLSAGSKNSLSVVDLNDGNVALVELLKINQPDAFEDAQVSGMAQNLATQQAQSLVLGVVDALKANSEVVTY